MLMRGTMMTVPEISAGFSMPINFSSAMIDVYSVPCAPATSASTGPFRAPWITATGMLKAASLPAGTSIVPVAFWPGATVAVPTEKLAFCPAAVPRKSDPSTAMPHSNRFISFSVPEVRAQSLECDGLTGAPPGCHSASARRKLLFQKPGQQSVQMTPRPRPFINSVRTVGIDHHPEVLVGGDQRVNQFFSPLIM